MDELLYTQEDMDEWIRTCEELQERSRELKEELSDLQYKYNLLAQENTQLERSSEILLKRIKQTIFNYYNRNNRAELDNLSLLDSTMTYDVILDELEKIAKEKGIDLYGN